jgi:lactoylglutathione lyase
MSRVVFNHVGHCVSDIARARRFYTELLGFEFWREIALPDSQSATLLGLDVPLDSKACYLRRDGFVLELIEFGAASHRHVPERRAMDEPGLTHISVSCDIREVCAHVAEYGGEVITATDIGVAVFIRDPDGQLVELLPLAYADRVSRS